MYGLITGKKELFELNKIELKAAEICSDNVHTIGIASKVKDSSFVALSESYLLVAYPTYFTVFSNPSHIKAKKYVRYMIAFVKYRI